MVLVTDDWVRSTGKMISTGKDLERNLSHCHSNHNILHMDWQAIEPRPLQWQATNHLNHSMAMGYSSGLKMIMFEKKETLSTINADQSVC